MLCLEKWIRLHVGGRYFFSVSYVVSLSNADEWGPKVFKKTQPPHKVSCVSCYLEQISKEFVLVWESCGSANNTSINNTVQKTGKSKDHYSDSTLTSELWFELQC